MGGAVSAGKTNDELVANLVEAKYISSCKIERIFKLVDRGDFFPGEYVEDAYKDLAWKQGNVHMSAPCIYSEVMEALDLRPGMSFLNLGSGTGYLSTLAGLLLGPYGTNHGVELFSDVVEYANEKVNFFINYSRAFNPVEFCKPQFVVGNCLMVNPSYRKYDRIYCGSGCPTEHKAFFQSLAKVGGILIMPFQESLMKYTRIGENEWEEVSLLPVQFAPLLEPERKDLADSIVEIASYPLSLQEICRASILQHAGENYRCVFDLPLHESLIQFLNFYRDQGTKPRRLLKKRAAAEDLDLDMP